MAKFFGDIGFATQVETSPGIWEDKIIEKQYYGDITREARRFSASEQVLDNINLSNQLSIIADGYVVDNVQNLRYVRWLGGTLEDLLCGDEVPPAGARDDGSV